MPERRQQNQNQGIRKNRNSQQKHTGPVKQKRWDQSEEGPQLKQQRRKDQRQAKHDQYDGEGRINPRRGHQQEYVEIEFPIKKVTPQRKTKKGQNKGTKNKGAMTGQKQQDAQGRRQETLGEHQPYNSQDDYIGEDEGYGSLIGPIEDWQFPLAPPSRSSSPIIADFLPAMSAGEKALREFLNGELASIHPSSERAKQASSCTDSRQPESILKNELYYPEDVQIDVHPSFNPALDGYRVFVTLWDESRYPETSFEDTVAYFWQMMPTQAQIEVSVWDVAIF